jgi:hypothetical protein
MALEKWLDKYYFIPKLPIPCAQISARCITCAQNNASQGSKPSTGIQATGTMPFETWKWTSQRSSPVKGTSTSWSLSSLTQGRLKLTHTHTHRKGTRGNKGPLERNYPQIWAPLSIGSDNRLAFMVEIVQGMAKILKIKWKLHTAYRPQSSGKVECMNQTLKTTLAKL